MPEKPTILVVDDDQPIVTLMRKLLVEFAGYAEKLRQAGESKFCMRP